jgi:formylglycine-generating enzyme required for sulfatase activity
MPPEAFKGERLEQSDIWSVGVILHQMLTGRVPFDGPDMAAIMGAIILGEAPPLPTGIPSRARAVVETALRKEPAKRYASCRAMFEALSGSAQPAAGQTTPGRGSVPQERVRVSPSPAQPKPVSTPAPGAAKVNPIDGAEMVYVAAGDFTMGSDDYDSEKPPHKVYLDGYWIYKNPVTVAQYRAFCNTTGHAMPFRPDWGWRDDHPVVCVTWDDATAYAKWSHASLPTEAQWEKAARGTDGRAYPWGNKWDPSRCAHSESKLGDLGSTKPVGSYPTGASPYGALDMAGNVWEWCADWYDVSYYKSSPASNPAGPTSGGYRVVRGGSWDVVNTAIFRAAGRRGINPALSYDYYGFRCVVRAPGP